jgi:hypothetical protein
MAKTPMAAGLKAWRPVDLLKPTVARVQHAEASPKSKWWEEMPFFLFPHAGDARWSCLEPPDAAKTLCFGSSTSRPNSALAQDLGKEIGSQGLLYI